MVFHVRMSRYILFIGINFSVWSIYGATGEMCLFIGDRFMSLRFYVSARQFKQDALLSQRNRGSLCIF